MAISFVGKLESTGATIDPSTVTGITSGDFVIAFAFRSGSTTGPTVPANWGTIDRSGANTCSHAATYRVYDGTWGSTTFTNASSCFVLVYRGVDVTQSTSIAAAAAAGGSSANITAPNAGTFGVQDGTSWGISLYAHRTQGAFTPGFGTERVDFNDTVTTVSQIGACDSNNGLTAWPGGTVTHTGSSGWRAVSLELIATSSPGSEPTFVSATSVDRTTTGTSKSTAAISVQAGDLLVITGSTADNATNLTGISGGSLTYTSQQSIQGFASFSTGYIWTAPVTSTGSVTVTVTASNTTVPWGFTVSVWRNHGGVGNSAGTHITSGAPSLNITTQAADSAVVWSNNDWNATDGATRTYQTAAGVFNELVYFRDAAQQTVYTGYHPNAGSAGTYAVGLTAPGSQKYTIAAVEILAVATGTTYNVTPSDSAGTTDTFSRAVTFNRTLSDSEGIADTFSRAATFNRTFSDSVGLTESLTRTTTFNRSLTDAVGLSDSLSIALTKEVVGADSVGIVDTLATTSTFNRQITDSAGLADTPSVSSTFNRVFSDSVGLADTFSIAITFNRSFADNAGLVDTLLTTSTFNLTFGDSAGLADIPNVHLGAIDPVIVERAGQLLTTVLNPSATGTSFGVATATSTANASATVTNTTAVESRNSTRASPTITTTTGTPTQTSTE